jgi:hypothetical protein
MHSLTLALDGSEWSASVYQPFYPRERTPGTCWLGGWVGARAGLDIVSEKVPAPARIQTLII